MTETERLKAVLAAYRDWNGKRGPVVPQWFAERLRKSGITEGFIEAKPLPLVEPGDANQQRGRG